MVKANCVAIFSRSFLFFLWLVLERLTSHPLPQHSHAVGHHIHDNTLDTTTTVRNQS